MLDLYIKTSLIDREEIFKLLALGWITKLPVLLVGPPGVGKTQALTDFISSIEEEGKQYIIELDYGTRASEVKGYLDIKKWVQNHEWNYITPIAEAKYILINEIDKGTPEIRNCLLSVMREKMLWLGGDQIACQWELFCGSCNEMSTEDADAPFWDRFPIKYKLSRLKKNQFTQVWNRQQSDIHIQISEIPKEINLIYIDKYLDLAYDLLTDRTIALIPQLLKGISQIWHTEAEELNILRLVNILTPKLAPEMAKILINSEWLTIRNMIENVYLLNNTDKAITVLHSAYEKIKELDNIFSKELISELYTAWQKAIDHIEYNIK